MIDILLQQMVKSSEAGFGCWWNRWGSWCSHRMSPVLLSAGRCGWSRQRHCQRCPYTTCRWSWLSSR